ncbi:MAG TPA: biotin--[acetyl-CoA-carboxylase] ligase [Anaerolineales bacterium]
MNAPELEKILGGLSLGPLRYYPQIGSTNNEAAAWLDTGAPDRALVVADEQISGRGRMGRRWLTPPGAALAFSLVLRPVSQSAALPQFAARLAALGALAICDALQAGYALQAQIKWPNDVLLERRKFAGILAETHWSGDRLLGVILGIGINVSPQAVPADVIFPATCIETVLGQKVDRWVLLRGVLQALLAWQARLEEPAFIQAWQERLAFRGEWVRIVPAEGTGAESRVGQVLGLEPDGALQLKDIAGQFFTARSGEVSLRSVDGGLPSS